MKNKGFTLIEMIVVVAIFSIITGTATGIFVSTIRAQRYSLAYQQILDQTSYAMEYMSRFLRMARKDDISGINCLVGANTNYENPGGDTSKIEFQNYHFQCQEFSLVGGQLMVKIDGGGQIPLTSERFNVKSLKFNIIGEQQPETDYSQPRVTIFMEIEGKSSPPPKISIQTTISQRDLDIEK